MASHLTKNLMTLSVEVILALLGVGLSAWYLTAYSIDYEDAKCMDTVDTPQCKKQAVYITILAVMLAVSLGMLMWGVSCY
jgi:nitric oxide reductase large subunit